MQAFRCAVTREESHALCQLAMAAQTAGLHKLRCGDTARLQRAHAAVDPTLDPHVWHAPRPKRSVCATETWRWNTMLYALMWAFNPGAVRIVAAEQRPERLRWLLQSEQPDLLHAPARVPRAFLLPMQSVAMKAHGPCA